MAEDLQIPISAPGAIEVARQLHQVVNAETAIVSVTAPAAASAGRLTTANLGAADATRALHEQGRVLAGRLAALGPEFGVVAELVRSMTLRHTDAAAAIGILGAAIAGATMLMGRFNEHQAEQKRKAMEVLSALQQQHQAYIGLTGAVDAAAAAQRRFASAPVGVPSEAVAARVIGVGQQVPLGRRGMETMGRAIAATPASVAPLSPAEDLLFGAWVRLGYGGDLDDRAMVMAFRGQLAANPGMAAALQQGIAGLEAGAPGLAAAQRHEAALAVEGMTPAARTHAVLSRVAERETAAGRPRNDVQIENYMLNVWGTEAHRRFVEQYPELGQLELAPESGWISDRRQLTGQYRELRFRDGGHTFIGGTHVHNHGIEDPSGMAAPGTRGFTGR